MQIAVQAWMRSSRCGCAFVEGLAPKCDCSGGLPIFSRVCTLQAGFCLSGYRITYQTHEEEQEEEKEKQEGEGLREGKERVGQGVGKSNHGDKLLQTIPSGASAVFCRFHRAPRKPCSTELAMSSMSLQTFCASCYIGSCSWL